MVFFDKYSYIESYTGGEKKNNTVHYLRMICQYNKNCVSFYLLGILLCIILAKVLSDRYQNTVTVTRQHISCEIQSKRRRKIGHVSLLCRSPKKKRKKKKEYVNKKKKCLYIVFGTFFFSNYIQWHYDSAILKRAIWQ